MGMIYEVHCWDDLRWHDTYIPSLMTIGSGIQAILRVLPQQFESLLCWYYWWEGFIMYATEMTSRGMVYTYQVLWRLVQAFKQHYGFLSENWDTAMLVLLMRGIYDVRRWDAILRFCLRNLRFCNVGITDGGIFYAVQMGSGVKIHIPSFIKIDSEVIGGYTYKHTDTTRCSHKLTSFFFSK
jgi:hypothetical protein